MNFGDLNHDELIKVKITNLNNSIVKIKEILNVNVSKEDYDKLELIDKVNYDLFLSYTLNTLYWMYLRTRGVDPNKNHIRNELNRVKDYMVQAKAAHDRITIRPRIKKDVARRFVKHGIWNMPKPNEKKESSNKKKKPNSS